MIWLNASPRWSCLRPGAADSHDRRRCACARPTRTTTAAVRCARCATSSSALPSRSRLAASAGFASSAARIAPSSVSGCAPLGSACNCSASARNCQRGEKPISRATCMLMTSRCEVGKRHIELRRILTLRDALDHDGHATRQPLGVALDAARGHQQPGFDVRCGPITENVGSLRCARPRASSRTWASLNRKGVTYTASVPARNAGEHCIDVVAHAHDVDADVERGRELGGLGRRAPAARPAASRRPAPPCA